MVRWLGVLALAWPFLEIVSLVWAADFVGLATVLILVLIAGLGGILLLRKTGFDAIQKLRSSLEQQIEPGHSIIDTACFAAAAILLIVPGFFSDFIALCLLLPLTRNWLLRLTARHFDTHVYRGKAYRDGMVEGEFVVVSQSSNDNKTNSGETKSEARRVTESPESRAKSKVIDVEDES